MAGRGVEIATLPCGLDPAEYIESRERHDTPEPTLVSMDIEPDCSLSRENHSGLVKTFQMGTSTPCVTEQIIEWITV